MLDGTEHTHTHTCLNVISCQLLEYLWVMAALTDVQHNSEREACYTMEHTAQPYRLRLPSTARPVDLL